MSPAITINNGNNIKLVVYLLRILAAIFGTFGFFNLNLAINSDPIINNTAGITLLSNPGFKILRILLF